MIDIKQILEKALPEKIADQYTEDFRACARLMLRGLLDPLQVAKIRSQLAERGYHDHRFLLVHGRGRHNVQHRRPITR